jgi:hypothetical protein
MGKAKWEQASNNTRHYECSLLRITTQPFKEKMVGAGGGEVAQIMYTHVRKCKNNKIKS